jgi:hypothetical protein
VFSRIPRDDILGNLKQQKDLRVWPSPTAREIRDKSDNAALPPTIWERTAKTPTTPTTPRKE